MKWFATRRFARRYKLYTALLCVLAAVLFVCLSLFADALTRKHALSVDMSFNEVTGHSLQTRSVLETLTTPVHVTVLMTTGNEDAALIAALDRYTAACPMLTYSVDDIVRNPALYSALPGSALVELTSECMIVGCESTGRYKVIPSYNYLSYGYQIETGTYAISGVAYEKHLTEAIVYVSAANLPTLAFLTGHGELPYDITSAFENIMNGYNYEIERVNLMTGDTLNDRNVLLILSPKTDITGSELQAISQFCERGGSMLITCDYADDLTAMPNYRALLNAFGVVPRDGLVMATDADVGSYYDEYPYILIPVMQRTDITSKLIDLGLDTVLLVGSRAFEEPSEPSAALRVDVMIKSREHAYLRDHTDGSDDLAKKDTDFVGQMPLALLSTRTYPSGAVSRAVTLGCGPMLTDTSWYASTCNADFIFEVLDSLNTVSVISLNISPKQALRAGVPVDASMTLPTLIVILLPVLVVAAALAVLLPRRAR